MKFLQFSPRPEWGIFLLRLFIGGMFVVHGLGKVFLYGGISGTVSNFVFEKQFPAWTAYASIFLEAIAGLMLLTGFRVRIACLTLIPVCLGIILYHLPFGWVFSNPGGGWEYPQFILISLIAIFLGGDDRIRLFKRQSVFNS